MSRLVKILLLLAAVYILFVLLERRELLIVLLLVSTLAILGIYDYFQKKHAILRNYPIFGHFRYILEFIRPEIQQYFISTNQNERPFSREVRSLVYQRAKNIRDTMPFGTQRDIDEPGYESIRHSLCPSVISEEESRITVGGKDCKKPYSASRLNVSAMSFGSLSKNAVLALNGGAKIGNFAHNTGEGGLSPYHQRPGGDIIWQLGTAYFGCRTKDGKFDPAMFADKATSDNVKMIEIKLSQGAKPAHGGILPAAKINAEIAKIRHVPMGEDCLSPPSHSAFSTPIELLEFVAKLRELSGGKPIGFKLCVGLRHQVLAICKAMLETQILPDFITIDGAEGGTGAAPVEFSNRLGEPSNDGLIFVNNALKGINLRDQIRIISSGKVANGFDMLAKMALGADLCNSARAMMFALGCIQALQCNANTCPTGVTTQNPLLVRGLVVPDKAVRVANFHRNTIHSFLELVGAIGVAHINELSPEHIYHRINFAQSKSYAEMYESLVPGALLHDSLPDSFARDWATADPNRF